jgi:hypothetical protein
MLEMAAKVVPPLDVTRWRSTCGGSVAVLARVLAPAKVDTAN